MRSQPTRTAALYARVSSQQQAENETIGSQVAALADYAAEHGYAVPEEWTFRDEGYSGASLVRPGLERVRDLAAQGQLEAVLVYSPDRLARKYAYQVLLVEELERAGVEVAFLKSSRGDGPEAELLLQFQGMIAEYERAQIVERCRRGKIHRARSGDVSVLCGAPYGFRYVRKTDTTAAYYEIVESEAQVVREMFRLYTREGFSIGKIARHLSEQGIRTRTGKARWDRSTLWGMLRNPAYMGKAAFGKTRVVDRPKKVTRPARQREGLPSPGAPHEDRPREEWIEIPVPAIVDETTFALAAEQLERNKRFASRHTKEPSLLQGILVCRRCGYAYYRSSTRTTKRKIYYYRCIGSDDHRWEDGRICSNKPVRQDQLDETVWQAVTELLADPALARQELDRRLAERCRSNPTRKQKQRLRRELTRYQKAVSRLIHAYQEELISLEELRERIPQLRQQENAARAQLRAIEAQLIDEETHLRVAESLESFLTTLQERAQTLSVEERQKILRLVVKEVLVDGGKLVIKHSIPASDGGSEPGYRLRWRSDHPALGSSGLGVQQASAGQHPGLHPPLDQLQHPAVADALLERITYNLPPDRVEEVGDVGVHHPSPPLLDRRPDRIERIVRRALRPEPVGAVQEIGLEDRLQHRLGGGLDHPIPDRRHPEVPLSPIRLRDAHPLDRQGSIVALSKLGGQLVEEFLDPLALDLLDGDTVHARGSPVASNLLPSALQEVLAVDLVVQRVEASARRPLGRPVQLDLELSGLFSGVVSHPAFADLSLQPQARDAAGALPSGRVVLSRPSPVLRPHPTPSRLGAVSRSCGYPHRLLLAPQLSRAG